MYKCRWLHNWEKAELVFFREIGTHYITEVYEGKRCIKCGYEKASNKSLSSIQTLKGLKESDFDSYSLSTARGGLKHIQHYYFHKE